MAKPLPSAEALSSLFIYDSAGVLLWRERGVPWWDAKFSGTVAGGLTEKGYVKVSLARLGRRPAFAHRVIWKMMRGDEPEQVDHINGNRSDNRLENLRAASAGQNQRNSKLRYGVSTYKGLWRSRHGKWVSRIKKNGKNIYIGTYETEEEAARAYDLAAERLHGEFARTNRDLGVLSTKAAT